MQINKTITYDLNVESVLNSIEQHIAVLTSRYGEVRVLPHESPDVLSVEFKFSVPAARPQFAPILIPTIDNIDPEILTDLSVERGALACQ